MKTMLFIFWGVLMLVIASILFKNVFPKSIKFNFCKHDYVFDRAVATNTSGFGESFTSTAIIYKCTKCGEIKKL